MPRLRWPRQLPDAPPLQVDVAGGGHHSMLREPHLSALARRLSAALAAIAPAD